MFPHSKSLQLMKIFFKSFFADFEEGRRLESQIRKAYGVQDLKEIGLRIEGRGTIVTDPAKVAALEKHKELQDKARRLISAT